jgi:hypothetical protein
MFRKTESTAKGDVFDISKKLQVFLSAYNKQVAEELKKRGLYSEEILDVLEKCRQRMEVSPVGFY